MKQRLLTIIGLFSIMFTKAETVDTTYYDADGNKVHPALSEYSRIMVCGSDKDNLCQFIDRKANGEKLATGTLAKDSAGYHYEGLFKTFYPNGKNKGIYTYKNGKLEGSQYEYDKEGNEVTKLYKDGAIQGDFYIMKSTDGTQTKYSTKDNKQIWESPDTSTVQTSYSHGTTWLYYVANNMVIDVTASDIREVGKWYRLDFCITNGTNETLDINPDSMFICTVDGYNRPVWSYERYMKKVENAEAWALALTGVAAGLNAYSASYTTSTVTTTTYSGGHIYNSYTTVQTYNPAGALYANEMNYRMLSELEMEQQASNADKSNNYLRRTTLYPGESINGYVLVERKRRDIKLKVSTIIKNADYKFSWTVGKAKEQVKQNQDEEWSD